MRLPLSFLIAFILSLAAIAAAPAQSPPAQKKGPPPAPPQQQQQAPAPAPIGPYKQIAVKPPPQNTDASFEAFRNQIAAIAKRKDRAALARLMVTQGFFWEGASGDKTDKRKSSIQNLAAALELDAQDGHGWDALAASALEPTTEPVPDRKGVMCGPAGPQFDDAAFEEVLNATQTDVPDWAFVVTDKIEVRTAGGANAPVAETLGMVLLRVLPEAAPPQGANAPARAPTFMQVVTPSGKTGFVPIDAIAPLAFDQLCYIKDATGWKIAGYFGGQ